MQQKKIKQQDIASFLEKEIIENQMANGVKLPSATSLAKKFNVSAKTADRALSLLEKKNLIFRKRGAGNFVKNNRPSWKALHVALFCNELKSPEGDDLTHMFPKLVCQKLQEHGIKYDIFVDMLTNGTTILNREEFYKYDALLIPAGAALMAQNELHKYNSDIIIFADSKVNKGQWHQVVFDFTPGFKKALEYCLSKHKKKFFIPTYNNNIFSIRREALLEAASSLGINSKDICIFTADLGENYSPENVGKASAQYFIENNLKDHVIITTSDFVTFGMMDVFKEYNYKQNRDFFLISYDNTKDSFGYTNEHFDVNSITHPLQEHADAICEMLENITRKKTKFYQAYFTCANNLVIRHEF